MSFQKTVEWDSFVTWALKKYTTYAQQQIPKGKLSFKVRVYGTHYRVTMNKKRLYDGPAFAGAVKAYNEALGEK